VGFPPVELFPRLLSFPPKAFFKRPHICFENFPSSRLVLPPRRSPLLIGLRGSQEFLWNRLRGHETIPLLPGKLFFCMVRFRVLFPPPFRRAPLDCPRTKFYILEVPPICRGMVKLRVFFQPGVRDVLRRPFTPPSPLQRDLPSLLSHPPPIPRNLFQNFFFPLLLSLCRLSRVKGDFSPPPPQSCFAILLLKSLSRPRFATSLPPPFHVNKVCLGVIFLVCLLFANTAREFLR